MITQLETLSASALADRGAHAVHAAAQCMSRAAVAGIVGDSAEATKQLEDARGLVRAARECARIIDDQGVLEACTRAEAVLGALTGCAGAEGTRA
jgi:hypothetical protein